MTGEIAKMGGSGVKNLGFWVLFALILYATFKGAA